MTETIEMNATSRTVIGKANRRVADTELPAVVYGAGVTAQSVSLDRHMFELILSHGEGISSKLIKLSIDGGKPVTVIVKAIQNDPVKGSPRHVDLWAIKMTQTITTTVPIHFTGDSPGVKAGGVMMHNLQSVQVDSLPTHMPESIEIDVSALEIGNSVHVSDLVAPDGVVILDAPESIVASVVPPAKSIEEEEAEAAESAAESAEPEVIGEKSADEE